MGPERSDAWAIERSFADPASFEIIFDRHYDSVYYFMTRSVGADAGPDLTQEVFLLAFDRRRQFRTEVQSARPWLFGIANNLVRRWFRSEARRRTMLGRWVRRGRDPGDFTADAIDRLSAQATRGRLRRALLSIPDPERKVLLLFALGDLSYEEIAEALSTPVGTVKSRLHRARSRLRRLLDQEAASVLGPPEPGNTDA